MCGKLFWGLWYGDAVSRTRPAALDRTACGLHRNMDLLRFAGFKNSHHRLHRSFILGHLRFVLHAREVLHYGAEQGGALHPPGEAGFGGTVFRIACKKPSIFGSPCNRSTPPRQTHGLTPFELIAGVAKVKGMPRLGVGKFA
jgi:hypothetical protein